MLHLSRRSRAIVALCGALCGVAAFATVPLSASSSLDGGGNPLGPRDFTLGAIEAYERLPKLIDPFDRPLDPVRPSRTLKIDGSQVATAPFASSQLPVLPPNRGAGDALSTLGSQRAIAERPKVIAIASGERSYALIIEGGTQRLVAGGDIVDGRKVVAIDAHSLVLTGGERLHVGSP